MKIEERTQINDVLNHLIKHKKITSLEAIKKYGATRLSGIIFSLRRRGIKIRTEIETKKTRYGTTSNIAVYYLEE